MESVPGQAASLRLHARGTSGVSLPARSVGVGRGVPNLYLMVVLLCKVLYCIVF